MGELSYALFAFAVALVWPLTIGATRRSTRFEAVVLTLAAIFVGVALLAAARSEDEREAGPDSESGSSVMAGVTP